MIECAMYEPESFPYWDHLVTCSQMGEIDAAAQEEYGISGLVLMENAGRAAWDVIRDYHGTPLVVCAGPGNNGGDALVMARWALLEGIGDLCIITSRESLGFAADIQYRILEKMGVTRLVWDDDRAGCIAALEHAGVILEGLTGTGLSGPVREGIASLIECINSAHAPVVSVDLPSGARDGAEPGEPLVRAGVTVVTGYRKHCLYIPHVRGAAGEIRQVNPGFPPALIRELVRRSRGGDWPVPILAGDELPVLPPVNPDSYKSTRGRVGIIGGAPGTGGAPVLAGLAALGGGAGMVRICHGDEVSPGAVTADPSLMVVADSVAARMGLMEWADAVVAGPGWIGATPEDLVQVMEHAFHHNLPLVLDAHALRLLPRVAEVEMNRLLRESDRSIPLVLTPHPGELAALTGLEAERIASDPLAALAMVSREFPAVVVYKSSVTYVRDTDGSVTVYDGRCPELGTAGSGDVLAGLIGTWAVRASSAGEAARIAVALHLSAGRCLAESQGWFTATELARALSSQERRLSRGSR